MDYSGNWSANHPYLANPRDDDILTYQQTLRTQPNGDDWGNQYYTGTIPYYQNHQNLPPSYPIDPFADAGYLTPQKTSIGHHQGSSSFQDLPSQLSMQQNQYQRPLSQHGRRARSNSSIDHSRNFTPSARERVPTSDPPSYFSSKSLPVAIPQMSKGRGVPFMRIYAPMLHQYGIRERDFIDFVDKLNVVSAASPPFKVLDLAGGFIGMVPHHWAQLTSNVMKLAAMGGTAIVSKSRTDAFLSDVNQTLFGSKGLRVRLVTSAALMASIGFPEAKVMTLPLMANVPLQDQPNFHNRLLQGLHGYVSATVPTTLPPATENINVLDKLSANQVARDIQGIDKKMLKQSEKQMKKMKKKSGSDEGGVDSSHKHARTRGMERKMKKVECNIQKINEEAARDMESGRHSVARVEAERSEALMPLERKMERLLEKEARRADKISSKGHGKRSNKNADEKLVEKLLWIFIDPVPGRPGAA